MISKTFSQASFEKARKFMTKEFNSDSKESIEDRRTNPVSRKVYDLAIAVLASYIDQHQTPDEIDPRIMRQC